MPKNASLKLNFLLNVFLTASAFLFPVITSPYISRVLLPEKTGQIAFATSIISYFALAARLGIPTYGIRACAQVRDNHTELSRTAQEIFIINLVMTIMVYIVFFISLFLVPEFHQERLLLLVISTTMLLNLLGMDWLYKSLEQYREITIRSLFFNLAAIFLTFFFVRTKEDYILYGGITVLASVGANVPNFVTARKYISFRPCGNYRFSRHLKPVFILFALSVATTIYTNLDVVMLRLMTSSEEVGYYDAAIKIKNLMVIFSTSLGTVLLPRISYYVKINEQKEFVRLLKTSFSFVFLTAVPLCIYFSVMARKSISLIFGDAYLPAAASAQIVLPTVLMIGLTNVIGIQMLVPLGKEKLVVYSTCIGAAVDVILNALLIPRYGCSGAAAGTLAAEFAVLLAQVWFIRPWLSTFSGALQIHRACIALFPAAALLMLLKRLLDNGTFPGFDTFLNTVLAPNISTFLTLLITASAFFGTYGISLLIQFWPTVRSRFIQPHNR